MAPPSVIANVKARATRANVTPRLKNSAPELASVTIAASTAGGGGSRSAPASSAAIHQVARNTVNDRRRSISVSGGRAIECAGVKLWRRPHDFATADRRQHAVENARVGFFLGDPPARNSFPIAITVGAQGCGVGSTGQRRDLFPFRIRGSQNLLCFATSRDEAGNRVTVCALPGFVEDVADHRRAALCAKLQQKLLDTYQAAETLCFQRSAEIPVIDGGVHFATEGLRRQQRWRTVNDRGFRHRVDAVLFHRRPQQQPILFVRAAADTELAALEIRQS